VPRASLFLLALFSLLPAVTRPVLAAAPVKRMTNAPITSHYDDAARALGFAEWGETRRSDTCVHVVVRLTVRSALVGINLPPSVPAGQAEIWLQELADAMQWTDAELSSSRDPGGTFLSVKIPKYSRPAALGMQRGRLDLPLLRTELRRLTPLPFLLCVRTSAQELIPNPPPVALGTSKSVRYAFFSIPGEGARPVTLTYGMGRRWRVALTSAWLAWALFPTLVFWGLREQLRRDEGRSPKERWDAYQRWLKPVWLATIAGAIVTPFLLSLQGVAYLLLPFAREPMAFMFVTLIIPSTWALAPAPIIGYPLSRELSERLQKRGPRSLFTTQLALLVLVHAAIPVIIWIENWRTGKPTDPFPWWQKLWLGLLFLYPLFLGLYSSVDGCRRWRHGARSVPPGEFLATPELTDCVRELTSRLGHPITRVLLVPSGDVERQRGAATRVPLAAVLKCVAEQLAPEQVAALIGAELLSTPTGWKDQLLAAIGITLGCIGFGSIAWMIFSSTTNSFTPSQLQIALAAGLPLSAIPLLVDFSRRRRRQEKADRSVADAIADPKQFLDALRVIEQVRMEASNLDPALTPVPRYLTERRLRLERRLGLE